MFVHSLNHSFILFVQRVVFSSYCWYLCSCCCCVYFCCCLCCCCCSGHVSCDTVHDAFDDYDCCCCCCYYCCCCSPWIQHLNHTDRLTLDIGNDRPVSMVIHLKASDYSYDSNYADDVIDGHSDDMVDAFDSIWCLIVGCWNRKQKKGWMGEHFPMHHRTWSTHVQKENFRIFSITQSVCVCVCSIYAAKWPIYYQLLSIVLYYYYRGETSKSDEQKVALMTHLYSSLSLCTSNECERAKYQ